METKASPKNHDRYLAIRFDFTKTKGKTLGDIQLDYKQTCFIVHDDSMESPKIFILEDTLEAGKAFWDFNNRVYGPR